MSLSFDRGFEATKAANYLIGRFDSQRFNLSNLKIQKSLFVIHAFCLVRYRKELVRNHFETWDHGPVVGSLYSSLKGFGSNNVTEKLKFFDYSSGKEEIVPAHDVENAFPSEFVNVCEHVVSRSVSSLYSEVHEKGGPWDKCRQRASGRLSVRIPNLLIFEHYENIFGGNTLN